MINSRPNIVLLLSDDHGWDETGYYGHPLLKTPVLDDMAATGLRFDRFYAAAPVCSPTRCSLMTGRHPNRCGCFLYNFSFRPEEITLAHVLREHGYATGHFGKWHLGPVKAESPVNPGASGFEEWLSHDNFFECNPVLSRNGAEPRVHYGESSDVVMREAIRFIDKAVEGNRPFFTFVCFGSPHAPYMGQSEDLKLYAKADISGDLRHRFSEITAMDRAIGSLRGHLKEKGLAENTVFWYMSDNGIPADAVYANPFRGCKGQLYEGGIRVASVLEYPALISSPGISEMPSVTSDILPTVLDLLDLPAPERPLDGISLVPHLKGETVERPEPICFWSYDWRSELEGDPWIEPALQRGTTPTGNWQIKEFMNFRHPKAKSSGFGGTAAIIDNRYKLLVHPDGKRELYDLPVDMAESRNLAGLKPELAQTLHARLEQWQKSVEQSLAGADYHD